NLQLTLSRFLLQVPTRIWLPQARRDLDRSFRSQACSHFSSLGSRACLLCLFNRILLRGRGVGGCFAGASRWCSSLSGHLGECIFRCWLLRICTSSLVLTNVP